MGRREPKGLDYQRNESLCPCEGTTELDSTRLDSFVVKFDPKSIASTLLLVYVSSSSSMLFDEEYSSREIVAKRIPSFCTLANGDECIVEFFYCT